MTSSAARQAEYRRTMKAAGYTARMIWIKNGTKVPWIIDSRPRAPHELARLRAENARLKAKLKEFRTKNKEKSPVI